MTVSNDANYNIFVSRLVKTRTLHGVPLCEVEWKMDFNVKVTGSWDGYPESFFTLESQQVYNTTIA